MELNRKYLTEKYGGEKELNKKREIDLAWKKITSIDENTFRGLIHLKKINLSFNEIRTIPETAFRGLINLKVINLSYNNLSEISSFTFKDQKKITTLWLNYNNLELFDPLIINQLNIKDNPKGSVYGRVLDLSDNPVSSKITINKDSGCYIITVDPSFVPKPSTLTTTINQSSVF